MIIKTALFIHILSTATLFGGIVLMVMTLRSATRSSNIELMVETVQKVHKWNSKMMVPVSFLSLLSGIYMMFQYANKPLWLALKERLGSLFIIIFILVVSIYGKKILTKIEKEANVITAAEVMKRYIYILNFAVLYMTALMFIVSFKF